jgi:flagellar biosynthesis protein
MADSYQINVRRSKRKQAVALGYDPAVDDAPRILAAGQGTVAERILELARSNGIPLKDDPILAEILVKINVGEVIPPELYQVVAEVLAYVYRIQHKKLPD